MTKFNNYSSSINAWLHGNSSGHLVKVGFLQVLAEFLFGHPGMLHLLFENAVAVDSFKKQNDLVLVLFSLFLGHAVWLGFREHDL